jgi:2'-5' RNA ligase
MIAIDVALLPPDAVNARAREINRLLADDHPSELRLDARHLPHVSLAQQFVEADRIDAVLGCVAGIARTQQALPLRIAHPAAEGRTVMFAIEPTPALQRLHETLMNALEPFDARQGGPDAFCGVGEAPRPRDVAWVSGYRSRSSYAHFFPHITLGHGDQPPAIEPFEFIADRLAVCHLGKFCTCRVVLAEWTLGE